MFAESGPRCFLIEQPANFATFKSEGHPPGFYHRHLREEAVEVAMGFGIVGFPSRREEDERTGYPTNRQ
jgi:hypothetical protein